MSYLGQIPIYGLCILIGLVVIATIATLLCHYHKLMVEDLFIVCGVVGLFSLVGAKLLLFIVSPNLTSQWGDAGGVFYGGVLGGILALVGLKKFTDIPLEAFGRFMVPLCALFHAFGRLGCLLTGCCYGIETGGHLFIEYHHSLIAPNHTHLFPVQGIEAVGELLIFGVLLYLSYGKKWSSMTCLLTYGVCYGLLRFILEFFRGDVYRGIYFGLSLSQWISLTLLFGIGLWFLNRRRSDYGVRKE